jgi:WASH complex subunit strumpellin
VSVFTEGILVMEKTLLGVIQVDPRQILEEGLRRDLVRQVTHAMHKLLTFKDMSRLEINSNMSRLATELDGLKRSIEYLQDYIGIAGLKIFQQEFARIINYHTEQEANRFLKRKIFDNASRFQSKAIPIPRISISTVSFEASDEANGINFMGRVMFSLLFLTDPSRTVYAPECSAWFVHSAPDQKNASTTEVCGIRMFSLLERSIGVIGLRGLNRLLAFRTVFEFNSFIKYYTSNISPFKTLLDNVRTFNFLNFIYFSLFLNCVVNLTFCVIFRLQYQFFSRRRFESSSIPSIGFRSTRASCTLKCSRS